MADSQRKNAIGQPIGPDMPGWTARARPPRTPMNGRFCRLEALDPDRHTADLADAFLRDTAGGNWTYLSAGPYSTRDEVAAYLKTIAPSQDPVFHTIIDQPSGKAVGIAGLMRIDPANGVIEVGHIHYSPLLQRHPAATEAMFLLMRRVFDELGYRRYEWKCDSLNAPSRSAALRLGFIYEGLFRQAVVYKGRGRDTTWFSITDSEWPALKRAYEAWLAPANFDAGGKQKMRLQDAIAAQRTSG